MQVSPYHSKLPSAHVYHNKSTCTVGNNIESYNKVAGTGGRPLCSTCPTSS
jgi:hypothetical protein